MSGLALKSSWDDCIYVTICGFEGLLNVSESCSCLLQEVAGDGSHGWVPVIHVGDLV